jgi:hypothetical protein
MDKNDAVIKDFTEAPQQPKIWVYKEVAGAGLEAVTKDGWELVGVFAQRMWDDGRYEIPHPRAGDRDEYGGIIHPDTMQLQGPKDLSVAPVYLLRKARIVDEIERARKEQVEADKTYAEAKRIVELHKVDVRNLEKSIDASRLEEKRLRKELGEATAANSIMEADIGKLRREFGEARVRDVLEKEG